MERGDDGGLILGPADLVGHLACAHLTHLERAAAEGAVERPVVDGGEEAVLDRRRAEYSAAQVARMADEGRTVVEIGTPEAGAPSAVVEEATVAAMREGADVIVHAAFADGRSRARADLLLRVAGATDLGPWGYEAVGTSLARRLKPEHVLRLAAVSGHVTRVQGVEPAEVAVITADGTHRPFPLAGVAAYHRAVQRRLEAAVADRGPAPYPDRVPHCASCPWEPRCDARRRADGHLSLVAGMRHDLVSEWAKVGITTVAGVARSTVGTPVPNVGQVAADRLRRQARLQLAQEADGRVHYELLPPDLPETPADGEAPAEPVGGLASLPAPSPGDLFFDIEGDPWVGDHGIQYLFGLVDVSTGEPVYTGHWAHTPAEERRGLERVVDAVVERFDAEPAMHVYHFAPYEVTVLRTLSRRYGTRTDEVDRLLAGGVFVDLYRVVREGIRISQEGYGLKRLEPLYLGRREGAVADGGASIVAYEEWLATGEQRLLDDLLAYNELDCRSTLGLRDWLEARRAELEGRLGRRLARPVPPGPPVERSGAHDPPSQPVAVGVGDDDPDVGSPTSVGGGTTAAGPLVAGSGSVLHPVAHEGDRTRSEAEAAAVAELVEVLVGRPWTDAAGHERRLSLDDVLVVTPFDDQVACLVGALPAGARVGTVDRPPVPDAPVVVCSFAASSAAGVPWSADRAFSPAALEAVQARARALTVVVASPSLLGSACRSVEQVRLLDALCRLAERAGADRA